LVSSVAFQLVVPRYEPNAINNVIGYAKFYSDSHDAVIRVYGDAGNVIETHEHARDFKELLRLTCARRIRS
jgi:hypothetical protein